VDFLLHDLHLRGVQFGENSITMSPGGTDVVQWSGAQLATAVREIGMGSDGRPSFYESFAVREAAHLDDVAGDVALVTSGNLNVIIDLGLTGNSLKLWVMTRNGTGNITARLPDAADHLQPMLVLKHIYSSSNGSLTIEPKAGDTINQSIFGHDLPVGGTLVLMSDRQSPSGNWRIIKDVVDQQDLRQVVIPITPGTTRLRGFIPWSQAYVVGVRVRMETVNDQGSFDLTLTNQDTASSMLFGATFDMNGLSPDSMTDLTLSTDKNNLYFNQGSQWTADFTYDDPGFNGSGVYLEVLYAQSEY
jgi:hypothetical protein